MDAVAKVPKHRMTVLHLAEQIKNAAEAWRGGWMDRASFYAWKRRFQTHGSKGLGGLPPISGSQPPATVPKAGERIAALASHHPARDCKTVLDGFLRVMMRKTFYGSVEGLAGNFDEWLGHGNTKLPRLGHRNQARRPLETVNLFVSQEAAKTNRFQEG